MSEVDSSESSFWKKICINFPLLISFHRLADLVACVATLHEISQEKTEKQGSPVLIHVLLKLHILPFMSNM